MGRLERVNRQIKEDANQLRRDLKGFTPLHFAVLNRRRAIAELLLDAGSAVNGKEGKWFPLLWAIFRQREEMAILLIRRGARIGPNPPDRYTPLHWSARRGLVAVSRLLLDKGARFEVRREKRSPFDFAIDGQRPQIVQLFVERGLDPNAKARDETPLLHWAAFWGYAQLAKALLEHGADPNVRNELGKTTLMVTEERGYEEIANLLRVRGQKHTATDLTKVLIRAVQSRNLELVKRLIAEGADVNVPDNNNITPLLEACRHLLPSGPIVEVLVEAGARVTVKDREGRTPLHWAALGVRANGDVVRFLLRNGADGNARDGYARTPLYYAANGRRGIAAVRALVEHGADVNASDKREETPLAAAKKFEVEEILSFLRS